MIRDERLPKEFTRAARKALVVVACCVTVLGLAAYALQGANQQVRPAATDPRISLAADAAEASLRTRLRLIGEINQRGVQVFSQARSDTYAVCGRAAPTGAWGGTFVPYVAVIAFDGVTPRVADFVLGMTGTEASRTFVEIVDRCFDGGGPPHARALARPLPPLPDSSLLPDSHALTSMPLVPSVPTEAGRGTLRTVITTSSHSANIRRSPQASEVVRVAPRATRLEVYGEAPGGWLQVGQGSVVWGWVHNSVLDPTSR